MLAHTQVPVSNTLTHSSMIEKQNLEQGYAERQGLIFSGWDHQEYGLDSAPTSMILPTISFHILPY